jgi:hypothetical protein
MARVDVRWALLGLTPLVTTAGAAAAPPAPPAPPVTLTADDACELRASATEDWTPAPAGTSVALGSWVRPRPGGELSLTFSDGVTAHLGAGASVSFAPRAWVPGEGGVNGGKPSHASQLMLRSGELTAHVPAAAPGPGTEPRALLVAAGGSAQVADWRGTVRIATTDDGVLATATDGAALVGSNGRWLTISAGSGAILKPRASPEIHHNLVTAPEWSTADSSPAFALVQIGTPASFTLGWAAVDRATRYRVFLASDPGMTHVLSTIEAGAGTKVATAQLAPGRYYATVEAASVDGLVGMPSVVRPLRIATMSLPPGASMARDGAILMPERTAIILDDPSGLDLALQPVSETRLVASANIPSAALTFLAAPPRLKLGTERQLVAFVKDTASGTITTLTLAQRQLRARVELSPKAAHWPENDVTARVTVEDPSGRIDVTSEDPQMRVRINIDEVKVRWARSGNTWVSHIPPAVPPGPWVVSVVAVDRTGNSIGEGYLEVAGPPRPAGSDHRAAADKTEVKILH